MCVCELLACACNYYRAQTLNLISHACTLVFWDITLSQKLHSIHALTCAHIKWKHTVMHALVLILSPLSVCMCMCTDLLCSWRSLSLHHYSRSDTLYRSETRGASRRGHVWPTLVRPWRYIFNYVINSVLVCMYTLKVWLCVMGSGEYINISGIIFPP